jgi:hypothetical protein
MYLSMISSSACHVNEICTLLGFYTAQKGNSVPTFRDNLTVPSSRIKQSKKSADHRHTSQKHLGSRHWKMCRVHSWTMEPKRYGMLLELLSTVKLYPESSEYFHVSLTQPQCNSGILYTVHVWKPINSVRKYGITALPNSIFHFHIKCDSHLTILRKILTAVRLQHTKWSLREAQWNKDMNKWPNLLQIKSKYPTASLECPGKHLSLSLFATTFHRPPRTHTSNTSPTTAVYELSLRSIWSLPLIILALAAFLNYGNIFQMVTYDCNEHRGWHDSYYGDCCRLEYDTV